MQRTTDLRRVYRILCCLTTLLMGMGLARMHYGYYVLLRLATFGTALVGMTLMLRINRQAIVWVCAVVALMYNPLIPLRIGDKSIWVVLNILTVVSLWWIAVVPPSSETTVVDDQTPPALPNSSSVSSLVNSLVQDALTESIQVRSEYETTYNGTDNLNLIRYETTNFALMGAYQGSKDHLSEPLTGILEIEFACTLKEVLGEKSGSDTWGQCGGRLLYCKTAANAVYKKGIPSSEELDAFGRVFSGLCSGKWPTPKDIEDVRWDSPLLLLGSKIYLRTYLKATEKTQSKNWTP